MISNLFVDNMYINIHKKDSRVSATTMTFQLDSFYLGPCQYKLIISVISSVFSLYPRFKLWAYHGCNIPDYDLNHFSLLAGILRNVIETSQKVFSLTMYVDVWMYIDVCYE